MTVNMYRSVILILFLSMPAFTAPSSIHFFSSLLRVHSVKILLLNYGLLKTADPFPYMYKLCCGNIVVPQK